MKAYSAEEAKTWDSIAVPGFDEMVPREQLFGLCALIGGSLTGQLKETVVFQGPTGKSTMCQLIQKLAERWKVGNTFLGGHSEVIMAQLDTLKRLDPLRICYFLDPRGQSGLLNMIYNQLPIAWWPQNTGVEQSTYWNFATFVCSQTPVDSQSVYVVNLREPAQKLPLFAESIPLDLLERKCVLAYNRLRYLCPHPIVSFLKQ
jgi:hypothetical protein